MEKSVTIAGITISGAEAELGGLIQRNIEYELVLKQLRVLHKYSASAVYGCMECRTGGACPTNLLIKSLEKP